MNRYTTINSNSITKNRTINKKATKAIPISLVSGGNSFFIKIKFNQVASNYIDSNNLSKPYPTSKNSNTCYQKIIQNITYNRNLNATQQKNSLIFTIDKSSDYKNQRENEDLNKENNLLYNAYNNEFYSFTTGKNNNVKTINNRDKFSSSLRQNLNSVLLTDVNLIRNNICNKTVNKRQDTITKKNNQKNINLLNKYKIKTYNNKDKSAILNKENSNLENEKRNNHNGQVRILRKKLFVENKRNNIIKYNITDILLNGTIPEKAKPRIETKENNCSEKKKKLITNIPKRSKIILNLGDNATNKKKLKPMKDDTSQKTNQNQIVNTKRIKSINTRKNRETSTNDLNIKKGFNTINTIENQSVVDFKKNNAFSKNNILLNKKQLNTSNTLTLTFKDSTVENSNSDSKNNKYPQIHMNNPNIIKNYEDRKKYMLSDLCTYNLNKHKMQNAPNLIMNKNDLCNYIPLVTLNNSVVEKKEILTINNNVFNEEVDKSEKMNHMRNVKSQNKKYNKILNPSQNTSNVPNDFPKYAIININPFVPRDNKIKKKNYKKIRNDSHTNKIDILDNNHIINNYSNNNRHKYFHSNNIGNSSSLVHVETLKVRGNSNNIVDNYVSKEKNLKKNRKNPPLVKNPKKFNILSLIQENNRKNKNDNQEKLIQHIENENYNLNNKKNNIFETIDYVLYPEKYNIKDDKKVMDNFDDMNKIIRRIHFEEVDRKGVSIFTVDDSSSMQKNNIYKNYCKNFDAFFEKKFMGKRNTLSATQNKIKNNKNLCHSRQSGSTKDSNKGNSSDKKFKVISHLKKNVDKK